MKKIKLNSYAMALLMVTSVLFSCQKTEHEALDLPQSSATQPIDPQHLEAIARMGYDTEGIRRLDIGYLVEGDILITEENLQNTAPEAEQMEDEAGNPVESAPGKLTRQTYYGDYNKVIIPSNGQCRVIKVRIVPNLTGWDQAIKDAIDEWNSIPNFALKLELSDDGPEIHFAAIQGGDNGFAMANIPGSGSPGSVILINANYNGGWLSAKQTAAHLLGHALGFGHSTSPGSNEYYDVNEMCPETHIPGTPTNDPRSVMAASGLTADWTGFTEGDKLAAQTLYPNGDTTPTPPTPGDPATNVVINGPATANVGDNVSFSITGYPSNVQSISWTRTVGKAVTVSTSTSKYATGTWKMIGPGTMTVECVIRLEGDNKEYIQSKTVTIKSEIKTPGGTLQNGTIYDFSAPHVPSNNSKVTWSGDGVEIIQGQGTANVKVRFSKLGGGITLKASVVDTQYGANFELSKSLTIVSNGFDMRMVMYSGIYHNYRYVNEQQYIRFDNIVTGYTTNIKKVELLNPNPDVVFDGIPNPITGTSKNAYKLKFLKVGRYPLTFKIEADVTYQGTTFPWSRTFSVSVRALDKSKVYQPSSFGGAFPFNLSIQNAGIPFSMRPGNAKVYCLRYVFKWDDLPPMYSFDGILNVAALIQPVEERGGEYYPTDTPRDLYSVTVDERNTNTPNLLFVNYGLKECDISAYLDIPMENWWGIPWDSTKWRITFCVIAPGKGIISSAQTIATIRTTGSFYSPEFTD